MINLENVFRDSLLLREKSPLVHNITNYVAMNAAANALIAAGASPLMSFCKEEMDEIVRSADAVVINIGCLDMGQIEAMKAAASAALRYGRPLVLDPVGAGASALRLETSLQLIRDYHPSIISANASEVLSLALRKKFGRGVDATQATQTAQAAQAAEATAQAIQAAKALAKASGSIVSMSGPVDCITDGDRMESISGGSPLMARVTAMGCIASAISGAFAAVAPGAFNAALDARMMMKICGAKAAERMASADGTGTFACRFIDELSNFGIC